MRKLWTNEQDVELKNLIGFYNREEISKIMEFSLTSIKNAVKRLGLEFLVKERRRFSNEDKILIKKWVEEGVSFQEIANKLCRSFEVINQFCSNNEIYSKLQPKEWTADEVDALIKLRTENPQISGLEISKQLGRSSSTVTNKLKELGLDSYHSVKAQEYRDLKSQGLKVCSKCQKCYPLDEYYLSQSRLRHHCKQCHRKSTRERQNKLAEEGNLIRFFEYKIRAIKTRAKSRGLDFDLDIPFLEDLYKQQDGKCFYTGLNMEIRTRNINSISVDRVDSSKGYTKENIVLCRNVVNNMKQDMPLSSFLEICSQIAQYKQE